MLVCRIIIRVNTITFHYETVKQEIDNIFISNFMQLVTFVAQLHANHNMSILNVDIISL